MNKIELLAKEMNVTENDLIGFLLAIKIWMDKGYTMEESIQKNLAQMVRFVNDSVKLSKDENMRELAIGAFFK